MEATKVAAHTPGLSYRDLWQILTAAEDRAAHAMDVGVRERSAETVSLCKERMAREHLTRNALRQLAMAEKMSHIACPFCGSREHTSGYGLAAGPMGAYTFCNDCDELIEFAPDLEGLPTESALRIRKMQEEWQARINAAEALAIAKARP